MAISNIHEAITKCEAYNWKIKQTKGQEEVHTLLCMLSLPLSATRMKESITTLIEGSCHIMYKLSKIPNWKYKSC